MLYPWLFGPLWFPDPVWTSPAAVQVWWAGSPYHPVIPAIPAVPVVPAVPAVPAVPPSRWY